MYAPTLRDECATVASRVTSCTRPSVVSGCRPLCARRAIAHASCSTRLVDLYDCARDGPAVLQELFQPRHTRLSDALRHVREQVFQDTKDERIQQEPSYEEFGAPELFDFSLALAAAAKSHAPQVRLKGLEFDFAGEALKEWCTAVHNDGKSNTAKRVHCYVQMQLSISRSTAATACSSRPSTCRRRRA